MNTITANQLKVKGISAIEANLETSHELVITVRGKEKFVVMDMEHYNYYLTLFPTSRTII